MSIGWFKKLRIETTTNVIILDIVQELNIVIQYNSNLTLEESLRIVDKNRPMHFPDEENIKTDLYSLFGMMVYNAYRYKRASDIDACGQEHAELVMQTAYDYLNKVKSKTKEDFEKIETWKIT